MWPFKRKRPEESPPVSPETQAVLSRTEALDSRVEALGVETRAIAREALLVRSDNHFGPALVAAFSMRRNA